ncbi:hypothetical protein ACFOG5_23635 [Pedobacter fastidiosus]|uniref:Uncharacterized protein n=1 Tax=Pedobacter fastidiosus TaxID=2765361 RepID=A0ABR7KXN9_9SPHI|nr:hypothetical protein [Pedobacter fastidiosus]MBC6112786.1 hypothetical protein [Pedobacter fastidiosus]
MCRVIDENSAPFVLALVDVGDRLAYHGYEGNVFKIAIIKTEIEESYYFMLDCGKTVVINKSGV